MYRKILFEKWIDPFSNQDENVDDFEDSEYDFRRRLFMGKNIKPTQYRGQVISSPTIGIFPLGEHNMQSKRYHMWIGHTNFRLTKQILDNINQVQGVEILKIITPYRFWIGIGFLFNHEKVKQNIIDKTCNSVKSELINKLNHKFKAWGVVKLINNKYTYYAGKSQEEVEFKLVKNKANIKKVMAVSWQTK